MQSSAVIAFYVVNTYTSEWSFYSFTRSFSVLFYYKYIIIGILILLISLSLSFFISHASKNIPAQLIDITHSPAALCSLLTTKSDMIDAMTEQYMNAIRNSIKDILSIPADKRTFNNTAQTLDALNSTSDLSIWMSCLYVMKETHPDETVRNGAAENISRIQHFFIEYISDNKDLFNAFSEYVKNQAPYESLNDEQKYFLELTMRDYLRSGINLPDETRSQLTVLKKELAEQCLLFDRNISQDISSIIASEAELAGISSDMLRSLERTQDGLYLLKTDYPTASLIMENCSIPETRKRFFIAFNNRAYPQNDELLEKIRSNRNRLSQLLGFSNYAALDLDDQMVETSAKAHQFIEDLYKKALVKAEKDLAILLQNAPTEIKTHNGKVAPWDMAYLQNNYKKQTLALDETVVAEYFPLEETIQKLLNIYTQFLGIQFTYVNDYTLWHPDVRMLAAYDNQTHKLLGYFFLDLFPRPHKYSHACHISLVPALRKKDNTETIRASVVLANFTKPTTEKPSLLKRNEVSTFFHEFGHALHALLGTTRMGSFSGTSTKRDFVELPSQMLEEWLFDPSILSMLSCHYKTGEPLPANLIDTIIAVKKFASGLMVTRQLFLSTYALTIFENLDNSTPGELWLTLARSMQPYIDHSPEVHGYASFGHLTGYGAKYYGYLWSQVFALDVFSVIKQHGLTDLTIGTQYKEAILSKGGSVDPNILLYNFLGRTPTNTAYLENIGLAE